MQNTNKKTPAIAVILVALAILSTILIADTRVKSASAGKTYQTTQEIPAKKVGLLLGTSKYMKDGRDNLYYKYRITAATELYKANKIEYILVSGDNGTQEYNEPEQMKQDLIKNGIPEEKIFQDYAGFRTWDSIIRAKEVFQENDFTIISQKFHNERALYIAKANQIEAIAYNAKEVTSLANARIQVREKLARVKVVIDTLINKQPKFLGETITIE